MTQEHAPILTAEQNSRLNYFLEIFRTQAHSVANMEYLHGMISALLCYPSGNIPNDFLRHLVGEMKLVETLISDEEFAEFIELVQSYFRVVAANLRLGNEFEILLLQEKTDPMYGKNWALGYYQGMMLSGENWLDLFQNDRDRTYLLTILFIALEDNPEIGKEVAKVGDIGASRVDMVNLFPYCVKKIHDFMKNLYFQRNENASSHQPARNDAKVGRNEPCPCGSGKKFKNCCGSHLQ